MFPTRPTPVLRRRAAEARQSLQEYLRAKLIEEASRPTVDEVLARAGARAGGSLSFKAATRAVRADRAVVDASVLATALADDGTDGDTARGYLLTQELAAPELIDLEVASVLRRQLSVARLDLRRAQLALADLFDLPMPPRSASPAAGALLGAARQSFRL